VTDWDFALGWLSRVDARLIDVIELRAADPPFSFPQIAQRLRGLRSHVTARRLYDRAMDNAFASAKFNGQQARGQV
jgi:hypothetical protein